MPYELVDHTADIGIRVRGQTLRDLFRTAGQAMFEQITDTAKVHGTRTQEIHVTGMDRSDLLVNWLRELLCCWTIDNGLIREIHIIDLLEDQIRAKYTYDAFDSHTHEILHDIKAVTYYGVSVDPTDDGWEATVIFDV